MSSRVVIVPNPAFTGEPRLLTPVCHDRSPFITVQCQCGYQLHLHETQIDVAPEDVILVSRCHECRREIEINVAEIRGAFQQMRDDGWIE